MSKNWPALVLAEKLVLEWLSRKGPEDEQKDELAKFLMETWDRLKDEVEIRVIGKDTEYETWMVVNKKDITSPEVSRIENVEEFLSSMVNPPGTEVSVKK